MDAFDNPARNGMTDRERDGASNEQSSRALAGGEFLAAAANVTAAASIIPLAIQAILVPDASGRIALPAGASIDDIRISGTDLIITLPNGQVFIIPGGAVDVPAIVVDGDTVPASTVAQLLENLGELNPEAGVRSSGGNFADPEGPIQDAYALGDLLPYTQLAFPQSEDRELLPAVSDEEPTIVIVTPDQPAGIAAATASVNEAGLPARGNEPAGSNSAANSETTTGSIVYDAGDGLDSITINGTAITAVGQVITTPLGQLVITSLTPGNVGYSYTLTDNSNANDNLTDPFTVVVTDNDGDTATATLTVSVIDDVPTARGDTDALAGGTRGPETGNVLTGAGTTSGAAGADTPGADGATLTGIRGVGEGFSAPGTVQGQYGALTINANGSYSYVRNPGTPGGVNDVFTYRIADGDGDTSTATLTIAIGDAPTTIIFVPGDGESDAGTIVREADLPARGGEAPGSQFDGDAASTSGTITFAATDGVGSVTIEGVTVTPGSLPQQIVSDATGTLVVTGYSYNAQTGQGSITYVYTLKDNILDGDGSTVSFDFTITDLDGDAASDTLDIDIVDDAPVARPDADSVTEDGPTVANGNVLTGLGGDDANATDGAADTQGADGATVTAVTGGTVGAAVAGTYGALTLNADGSYSYALNNAAQPVQGLAAGETLTEVFTYTITDGDGDTSTTTLTIIINGADDGIAINGINTQGGDLTVDEDDLADGSSPDAAALTQAGSLSISTPDGLGNVTIGGTQVVTGGVFTAGTATSPLGAINITGFTPVTGADGSVIGGTFTYNYVLADNTLTHSVQGQDNVTDSFAVVVTDSDGSTGSDSIDVRVIDDVPTALPDVDRVTEDSGNGDNPPVADGNVLTGLGGGDANATDGIADIQGADGAVVTAVTGGSLGEAFAGAYGSLMLGADGSYRYVLNNQAQPVQGLAAGETLTEVFTYTITDGDGDTATATLTIIINGADDGVTINGLNAEGAEVIVNEDDLADGSSPDAAALTQPGSFTVSTPDGLGNVTIGGTQVVTNGVFTAGTATSPLGLINITGFTPVIGADGSVIGGTFAYNYVLSDNTLTHTSIGEDFVSDSFAVVVTDSDGSGANASLDVRIIDDVPTAGPDTDSVTEDGPLTADGNVLTGTGGTDGNATDGAADVPGADGASVTGVSFGATAGAVGAGLAGAYGTLTLNADGSYSYVLNNAAQPVQGLSAGQMLTETFTYIITDGDGDPSPTTLTIMINGADDGVTINGLNAEGAELFVDEDDLPARAGEAAGSDTSPDSLTDSDSFSVSTPDGMGTVVLTSFNGVPLGAPLTLVVANGSFTPQSVATAYGTLNVTGFTPVTGADGSVIGGTFTYSYTLTDNRTDHPALGEDNRTDSVGVTVTDIDGSTASATIDIRITDDVPDAIDDGTTQVVENAPVTINVLANDAQGADSVQPSAVQFVAGSLTGTGTLVNNGDGSFTYTPGAQETGSISFQYRVTDGDGDTDVATATITLVADSAPQIGKIADVTVDEDGLVGANADNGLSGEVTSTGSASANGTIIVDFGSDVPATLAGSLVLDDSAALDTHLTVNNVPVTFEKVGNDLVGSVGGNEVIRISLTAPAAGPGATQVTYGYTVTLSQAIDQAVPGSEDSDFLAGIGFTVTDNDGTTASGAFGVTIVDDLPTLNVSDAPTTVVEGATANGTWTLDRGADGVSSVNVSFGSGSATLSLAPGSSVSITEPTGTLTVNADGTFSFAAVGNQNNAANPSATFTLSAVDRDGDPTSDSLTIAIADGAIPANAAPITLTVNEAALANGSTPPSPDEVASGDMIFTAGSDTLSGFAFTGVAGLVASLDGAGTDIYWTMAPGGQTITGSLTPDGPAAITISLTAPASIAPGATGTATVTVTLAGNLPHALAMAAQTQPLGTVTVQATDTDGDPATGVVTVQVTDDVPAVTAAAGGANALTVDDSDLATNATANFGFGQPGSLFDVAFNADGPAAVNSIVYALGVKSTGIASGLVDTITGQSVVLTNEAGVVYGRTSGSGAVVFTLTVDANGTVTLDQQRPVFHSPDTGADQAIGLSAADLITLTATVTDSDGDPASATANIGGSLTFKDDGVNIDIAVVSEANVLLTTQDGETIGAASDFAVSTANFSDAFAFANADFGEDGAGSITWNYLLSLFGADGADSGLDSNGFSIFLYNVSGVITGSTAANAGAVNPGNTVFTLDANAANGTVTLTQFAQIDHDGPGVDSNFENQLAMLADNLVRLTGTVTITDRDGDTDSATQSIDLGGNIRFADDGPVLDVTLKAGAELLIDETNGVTAAGTEVDPDATGNLGSATIAIADLYTVSLDAGADTPVSYSYAFVLGGANPESGYLISATNEVIRLYQASLGTVEGRGETSGDVAFTFTVAANGTVTMTQLIAIEHGNTASNDESSPGMNAGALLLQVTATDFDGDFSSDTVDLGSVVRIEDDGPSITNVAGSGIVTLDETGGFDTVTSADPVITAAFAYGADGPASTGATTYGIELTTSDPELDPAAVDSGLKTAVGDFAVMLVETSATTIAGRYTDGGGTHDAFTITIGSDGKLTVTQLVALEHLQDGELALHNDALTLTGLISATVTIKDGDNDTATAKTEIGDQITFLDDGLTANADIKSIIEGAVATGNVLTDNADSFGTDGAEATSPAGGVVGVRAAGGDMTTPVTTGTGTVISTALGDLTLNADGSYSYDAKPNTTSTIVTDVFVYTIRDADGDTSTTTLTITIQPVTLAPDNQTKTVDEAGLDLNQDGDDVAEGTVTGSNPGATTETVTGTLGVTGTGVTYTPQTVEDALGKFVLNANGTYTYTLKSAFDGATLDNDITTENGVRVFNYTATDANGNSVPGTITINVIDDIPTARADTDAVAEDSGLPATGNVVTGVGTTNAPGSADTQGADGAAVTGVAAGTPAGDVTGNIGVAVAGSYGSLTLDAIGGYTYTLNNGNATVQALGVNESLTETYTYTLTDGDGDRTTTTLTITINGVNDAPTVTNNAVWMSSDPAQQTATTPTFANGYPLNVVVPTDVDGDPLVVTASNAPTGVFYFNGTSYVALTTGTILFDTDAGINLLDDLVYRPTATANDTVDVTLNLGVSDGTTSVTQSVFIHEVAPTRLPGQNAQIGDGSSPLTSGNDQEVTLTLTPEFAAGLNGNANIAVLELFTDFQKSPFDSPIPVNERDPNGFGGGSAGSKREEEVTVEITIDGNRFVVVQDDDTAAQFEQTWLYDSASGLMKATVPYTSIFLLDGSGNPTGTTLADYLTANPPVGGDTWELTYLDDDGGSFQARLVRFEFKYNDAGNPAITVNGDPVLADTIYGTSGNDTLNGNGGNDIIYGRGGNDVVNGGDGDDTLFGNDGNDTITGGPGTDAIDGGSGTNTITPPVVLDLDGDGLEFVDTSAGVRFDFDGDGIAEATAWTAPDDGLLVYDVNGDRQVSGASELVLANYADGATTDLDALRLAFDTNGDGQFTAADAEFASFGAWQDINSNGVADAGEYHTLTELGITAIDLHSDGQSYRAASGEVLVFGQSNFTRADGSRGTVGDVSFATRQADGAQRAVDQSSNQALASSLVAASLIVGIHDAQPDSVASPIAVTRAEPGIDQADGGVAAAAVDASALATPSSAANDSLAETPKTAAPDTSTLHSDEASPAAIDGAEDSGWRSEATDNADTGNSDSLADMVADRGSFDPGVMDGLLALAAVPAEAVAAGSDAAAHDPAAVAVLAEVLESGGSTVDQLIHAVTGGPEPVQIAAGETPAFDLAQFLDQQIAPDVAFPTSQPLEADLHAMAAA